MEGINWGWQGLNSNALLVDSIATTIIILKVPKHFTSPFREQKFRAVRNFKQRFVN